MLTSELNIGQLIYDRALKCFYIPLETYYDDMGFFVASVWVLRSPIKTLENGAQTYTMTNVTLKHDTVIAELRVAS